MLEKPGLNDEQIISCLRDEYGLRVEQLSLLPLSADPNTSVYWVAAQPEMNYFLKLRKGDFDEASIAVPNFLEAQTRAKVARVKADQRSIALRSWLGACRVTARLLMHGRLRAPPRQLWRSKCRHGRNMFAC